MFRECDSAILNKIDLLPYLDYDIELARKYILDVHPDMPIFDISAKTGEGVDPWLAWLRKKVQQKQIQSNKRLKND